MAKKLLPVASLILWFLLPALSLAKDGYTRNPDVDIIHYCFRIYLNDSTDRIEGSAGITINLSKKTKILELDLVGCKQQGHRNGY